MMFNVGCVVGIVLVLDRILSELSTIRSELSTIHELIQSKE